MKITLTNGYPYNATIDTNYHYSPATYVLHGIEYLDFTYDFIVRVSPEYDDEYAERFDKVVDEPFTYRLDTTDSEGFYIPAIIIGDIAYYGMCVSN